MTETSKENFGRFSSEKWVQPIPWKRYLLVRELDRKEPVTQLAYFYRTEGQNFVFFSLENYSSGDSIRKYFSKRDDRPVRDIKGKRLDSPAFLMTSNSRGINTKYVEYIASTIRRFNLVLENEEK